MFSPWLLGKVAADEAACLFRRARMPQLPTETWRRIATEVNDAEQLYDAAGWLERPTRYHHRPPPPERVKLQRRQTRWLAFEHLQFDSEYTPPAGEPGAARWMDYAPCRTAHAWLLRHRRGAARPWLVCIPGYSMGAPWMDCSAFQTMKLGSELGLNVAIPVLPLHGPRRTGWMSGDGYFSGDCLDTLHAQAQAVWDVRRLLAWLRANGAESIGLYGLSLGGYTAALLAALEQGLRCVIAGIPATDFVHLGQHHTPPALIDAAESAGLDWERVTRVFRVISPLAMPVRVAWRRRFLFAGTADRIVPLIQARRLWQHWERPHALWYRGSHLSFTWEPQVQNWLFAALRSSFESVTATHEVAA
jgi:hypothetical protein